MPLLANMLNREPKATIALICLSSTVQGNHSNEAFFWLRFIRRKYEMQSNIQTDLD